MLELGAEDADMCQAERVGDRDLQATANATTRNALLPEPASREVLFAVFESRASLYVNLDYKLASRTRFFAAAAVINRHLAHICSLTISRWWLPSGVVYFLAQLGARLEEINMGHSQRVAAGYLSVTDLDTHLVRMEQSAVEVFLANAKGVEPNYHRRIMNQLNLTMNYYSRASFAAPSTSGVSLAGALRRASDVLGRDVDFCVQGDRELVGTSLIRHIRETASADESRIQQCVTR